MPNSKATRPSLHQLYQRLISELEPPTHRIVTPGDTQGNS
jgi:hypothetical protein